MLPPVGQEGEVEVGEAVVTAERLESVPGLETSVEYSAKGIRVPPGRIALNHKTEKGDLYQAPNMPGGIFIPNNGGPPSIYWDGGFGFKAYPVPDIVFTRVTVDEVTPNGLRRELVYTGVSKGTVSLLYREFSGDLARPAFSQALTYDLAEGDEIGYRGARFKVLKATNTSIRFLVLKPFDAP